MKTTDSSRPNDGAIADSLGWVLFRQGNVVEATKMLERAVGLEPQDPTITEHLGDAYWATGRRIEAQYQWRRALTLNPTPEDAAKLAAQAGVKALVFYHTIPPLPVSYLNAVFLGDARALYSGPISVSTDGLLVTLASGGTTITQRNLL